MLPGVRELLAEREEGVAPEGCLQLGVVLAYQAVDQGRQLLHVGLEQVVGQACQQA